MGLGSEIGISLRSLHALTSAPRMDVLRLLLKRRMTAAEVSAELKIRKSSAHKHLTRLAEAGFLMRHDDADRVWVYYSLTPQGRHLVKSERPRIALLFATAAALLILAVVYVAWRAYEWRNPDGDGTWGVDEIFPRVRPAFFTASVILAMAIGLLALTAAVPLARRLTGRAGGSES